MNQQIALGFGGCIDYEIVWDSQVMAALIHLYGIRRAELDIHRAIQSERDLVVSVLSFVEKGNGGERWVANSTIIEAFAQRFERKITLGGSSVRAAIAMHKLGHTAALHLVTINEHVRRLLPPGCPYLCSNDEDSSHPHLIIQFDQGIQVPFEDSVLCAPRANRLIYHHDIDNIAMKLDPRFATYLADASVLLISGFNAMQEEKLLRERLATLRKMMEHLRHNATVFYEDAGFYNPAFHQLIHTTLAGRITIFSLNEDELEGHIGRKLDILDPAQIADALPELQRQLPMIPVFVIHTMTWALAYGNAPQCFAPALRGGITMATTRFCYGDTFTATDHQLTETLPPHPQGAAFAVAIEQLLGQQVCCVPVPLVKQTGGTTIGLGDAFVGGFLPALLPHE